MFIANSENQNVISKLILSETTFGIFGVVLLVVMLFFAFAGTASESGQQNAKAPQNKPVNSALLARNMK
ncbi:MAG TPA: hypothetical protein PLK30_00765 [Blastocatellia bacterium]|nr:hypothetical protein [Blastocatellia bacterium]